jgi:hypothetical protein
VSHLSTQFEGTLIKELANVLFKSPNYSGVFRFFSSIQENQKFIFDFMSKLTTSKSTKKYCESHPVDYKYCGDGETCLNNECIVTSTYYHASVTLKSF